MQLNDHIDMKGRLRMQFRNRQGEMVRELAANNAIVLNGRDMVSRMFLGPLFAPNPISHLAVGTGALAVTADDTTLGTEVFRTTIVTPDPTTDLSIVGTGEDRRKKLVITAELDFDDANFPLTEAGLFNAALGGDMYNRVKFDVVTKTNAFKLTLIWEITF